MFNSYQSGTMQNINLNYLNKLFEMMKDAIFFDSEQNRIPNFNSNSLNNYNFNNQTTTNSLILNAGSNIFQTIKSTNKPNTSIRGQKIFNIVKENNHSNKRSVKIIYINNEENNENSHGMYNLNNVNYEFVYNANDLDNQESLNEKYESEVEFYENDVENYNTQGEMGEENFEEENKNEVNDDYFHSYSSWKYIFK
jgi:hypothetical protein